VKFDVILVPIELALKNSNFLMNKNTFAWFFDKYLTFSLQAPVTPVNGYLLAGTRAIFERLIHSKNLHVSPPAQPIFPFVAQSTP